MQSLLNQEKTDHEKTDENDCYGTLVMNAASVYSSEGSETTISNYEEHNKNMSMCVNTARQKHTVGGMEVEFLKKDEKFLVEVEIQGKDGKKWKVSCDAVTGEVTKEE